MTSETACILSIAITTKFKNNFGFHNTITIQKSCKKYQ